MAQYRARWLASLSRLTQPSLDFLWTRSDLGMAAGGAEGKGSHPGRGRPILSPAGLAPLLGDLSSWEQPWTP